MFTSFPYCCSRWPFPLARMKRPRRRLWPTQLRPPRSMRRCVRLPRAPANPFPPPLLFNPRYEYRPQKHALSPAFQVLATFASVLYAVRPERVPGFAFAWLELVSHRLLLPPLLQVSSQRGWPLAHRLIHSMMRFIYPALRRAEMNEAAQLFHRGLLRVLLLLLHDFPDFLADYAPSFVEVLPPLCVQMRNLVLSATPRAVRLADPFAPALVMTTMPECSVPPRMLWSAIESLPIVLRAELDAYVRLPPPRATSALFQVRC
jgi:CCR4-NOT transcription complex subunit 1